jgi:hypothetical protein
MLLQAAQCDNCKSVTASFTTEQRSCSAHNNFPPPMVMAHTFRSAVKPADVLQVLINAAFWRHNFQIHVVATVGRENENFQDCCWRNITGILYRNLSSWLDTDRLSLNFARNLSIQLLRNADCVNISVFSGSLRTAHCGQLPSVCLVRYRVLQLQWAITSKYRSLLLLFCALNLQIVPWNNVVGKGKKERCDDNWICFNNATKFCSRLALRVQFKLLL